MAVQGAISGAFGAVLGVSATTTVVTVWFLLGSGLGRPRFLEVVVSVMSLVLAMIIPALLVGIPSGALLGVIAWLRPRRFTTRRYLAAVGSILGAVFGFVVVPALFHVMGDSFGTPDPFVLILFAVGGAISGLCAGMILAGRLDATAGESVV
jgi:hypothetical protein